jgi:hypothetical protein
MGQNPSKNDMIQNVISSYQLHLRNKGIDEKYLSKKLKDELNYLEPCETKKGIRKRKTYRAMKIRQDGRKDAQKLLGLYPTENINVQHGFDSIIADVISEIHENARGLPPLPSQELDE